MNWLNQLQSIHTERPAPAPTKRKASTNYALTGRLLRPFRHGTWRYEMVKRLRAKGYITSDDVCELAAPHTTKTATTLITRFVHERVLVRSKELDPPTAGRRGLRRYTSGPNARLEDDPAA